MKDPEGASGERNEARGAVKDQIDDQDSMIMGLACKMGPDRSSSLEPKGGSSQLSGLEPGESSSPDPRKGQAEKDGKESESPSIVRVTEAHIPLTNEQPKDASNDQRDNAQETTAGLVEGKDPKDKAKPEREKSEGSEDMTAQEPHEEVESLGRLRQVVPKVTAINMTDTRT